jgi:flagellar motor switch protein FliM
VAHVSTATTAAAADERVVRTYDFRRPTKLSRDHLRVLEMAFDTLARQWTTLLTTQLRAQCTVGLVTIQQMTYDEYISGLDSPTSLFLLELDPISGAGLMDVSMPVAMTVVDHLLGGVGRKDQPRRTFTEIESTLVQSVMQRALGELGYAFEGVLPLAATIAGVETSPQFAQAASPSDSFVVAYLDLAVGGSDCVATLALPFGEVFAAVERSLQNGATGRDRVDREAAARAVTARLTEAAVEVAVVLGPTLVRLSDIVNLRPGDVVRLGHAVSEPLAVTSAGLTFAHAVPGSEGSRTACLIVRTEES